MSDRTCSVDGCERSVLARGWCSKHYQRWKKRGTVDDPPGQTPDGFCSVEDCDQVAWARSWCKIHYYRWYRNGTLEDVRPWANARAGMKWCPRCQVYKRTDQFSVCRWTISGFQSWCKRCMNAVESSGRYADLRRAAGRRRRAKQRGGRVERYTATEIARRDGWRCQICHKVISRTLKFPHPRSLTIDHIIPISCGGDDTRVNVQAAHFACNLSKSNGGTDQLRLLG